MNNKLKKDFYTRNVLAVAKDLLGKIFVYQESENSEKLMARIVEVEAYDGNIDEAAHTFIGKTERNKIMFEEGGFLYVYFTYGKHFCANIVTGVKDHGTAILLRGMEPISGINKYAFNRFAKREITEKEKINLLNGPAKICQAFNLDRKFNGTNLIANKIYLLNSDKIPGDKIVQTTRIGIKKSVELPWRFYIKDNKYVSKLAK
ncbi:MAG: DNA-3-methyladenine glycosylase [Ignavibacteriae bacterium]|nr:DNA-3-methyladenine glycosylase [Ignavibacteriota bacterium]MCB9207207.1 DNA-3-methyladenine glycosylase [Ignavibacteriales bacterium]MCB9210305.1 DNA-3-methyladenine glycosylase [Ignavibacteriales bacterium]MCB9219110.1 DNA-3-methyladenine glycosylase [Ignavibacteriales bacterium]MCB9259692.1 DNA-3-methyladenine glycosylase [Ignavibacteriales bacterium]